MELKSSIQGVRRELVGVITVGWWRTQSFSFVSLCFSILLSPFMFLIKKQNVEKLRIRLYLLCFYQLCSDKLKPYFLIALQVIVEL